MLFLCPRVIGSSVLSFNQENLIEIRLVALSSENIQKHTQIPIKHNHRLFKASLTCSILSRPFPWKYFGPKSGVL